MSSKQQSILLGGLVIALLSTSYLGVINSCCCIGIILGGIVTVWHYTNENELTIMAGEGAAMGALAGVAGALIAILLDQVVGLVGLPTSQEIQQMTQEWFTNQMTGNMDPDQLDQMREQQAQQQEQFNTPMMRALFTGVSVVVSAIFASIGGAIGASMFKKGGDPVPEL